MSCGGRQRRTKRKCRGSERRSGGLETPTESQSGKASLELESKRQLELGQGIHHTVQLGSLILQLWGVGQGSVGLGIKTHDGENEVGGCREEIVDRQERKEDSCRKERGGEAEKRVRDGGWVREKAEQGKEESTGRGCRQVRGGEVGVGRVNDGCTQRPR